MELTLSGRPYFSIYNPVLIPSVLSSRILNVFLHSFSIGLSLWCTLPMEEFSPSDVATALTALESLNERLQPIVDSVMDVLMQDVAAGKIPPESMTELIEAAEKCREEGNKLVLLDTQSFKKNTAVSLLGSAILIVMLAEAVVLKSASLVFS